jgi:hypothetical protein
MPASAFGADPGPYAEMVAAGRTGDRRFNTIVLGALLLNLVLLAAFHVVVMPGALGLWLIHRGVHRGANRSAKAMGITAAAVRRARPSGSAWAGRDA